MVEFKCTTRTRDMIVQMVRYLSAAKEAEVIGADLRKG